MNHTPGGSNLRSLGVVRKGLGYTFEGETRTGQRIILADIEIEGLSDEVGNIY